MENLSPKNVERQAFQHKRAIPSYLSTSNVDKFVKKCAEMKKYTLNGERVILVSDTEVR